MGRSPLVKPALTLAQRKPRRGRRGEDDHERYQASDHDYSSTVTSGGYSRRAGNSRQDHAVTWIGCPWPTVIWKPATSLAGSPTDPGYQTLPSRLSVSQFPAR